MITSKQLRSKWLSFYESKGHVNIGAVSLIGDGSTGVMFNVAGMQPLMPYLLGQPHPAGKRLCNVQGCVRTVDIESVGDATHFTFFEMMGNWSLGDYFKKEKTAWSFELLTKEFGLDPDKICSTVFAGNESVPRDDETAQLLISLGIRPEHIYYLDKSNNWWELEGTVGTPCGPDNEWFYPLTDEECGRKPCDINCPCGRYVEIGNDVYMQYKKTADGYVPLENKNVDTGFGLDRMLAFLNGLTDGYKTDLFSGAISYLEKVSGKKYDDGGEARKAMRIIADHTRTTVMLIGDVNGILPSNTGAGYILRRLMRRAIRYCKSLGIAGEEMCNVAKIFIEEVYGEAYPLLPEKEGYILEEIGREIARFESTLEKGMKEFEKTLAGIERKNEFMAKQNPDYVKESVIGGKAAFKLYDTYGFPLELTVEMAAERGYTVDEQGFNEAFKEHQEKSHVVAEGQFKGGLADTGVATTRLHTATHLLNAALKQVLSPDVNQKGSNITPERLRFDFNFPRPMTQEEIAAVEKLVNEKIAENIPVVYEEMPYEQARAKGIVGVFDNKYGDVVKTYSIGNFSREMCGGPHAASTGELGHFKIVKEQSSASGIRRIKAILE
ncbi:MAG TPA: alanine--tRNA ligase [Candidatus Borkfalkia faecipullorum]|uniref:Alanine--tRNA ligase n=1 Tax=Candidatus Borkfalkia faecipullorum TaxID=2838510 RepID=A0A9D1V7E4_9FIRM|nr:alanine--tRNA ligase [Candidatus Borkfalkia faecipullorum]